MASVAVIITVATVAPPMLVVIPMMIVIKEAFARFDNATRYSRECDQPQQQTPHDHAHFVCHFEIPPVT
jgi:hypothetical protein